MRGRRRLLAAISCLSVGLLSSGPVTTAAAAETDDLSVGFRGSLVGTTAYTTTEGERMRGVLRRVDGGETQLPGGGVRLAGGNQGIQFSASDFTLGGATAFAAELELTPTGTTASMGTWLSAGGNLYVRTQNGRLVYGFHSYNGSTWTAHARDTITPAANTAHQLSLHYAPTAGGATLNVTLDGQELPPVVAPAPMTTADGRATAFGFGTEVHPAGAGRGVAGDLLRVRVVGNAGAYSPTVFEYQDGATRDLLNVGFDGTVANGAYQPTAADRVDGSLTYRAGTTSPAGKLTLTAKSQGADFTAATSPFGTNLDRAFVAEAKFRPTGVQGALTTILSVGGNLFARYRGDAIEVGFSALANGTWRDFTANSGRIAPDADHAVSLAYVPTATGAELTAWVDGVPLSTVVGTARSTVTRTTPTMVVGNEVAAPTRALIGTVDQARFALLNGAFAPRAFKYQERAGTAPCQPLGVVEPANYIAVTTADCADNLVAKAAKVRPTEDQRAWQELGLTAFIHFGINTFYDQEWGHGTEDPARFQPTAIDVDSWVKNLRDTGHRMAVLTVKHHDGFVLYPSRYTDYTVAATPWENGRGDILREFTAAARKYGMKVGAYLSPADSNAEIKGVYGNGSPRSARTIPTLVPGDDRAGRELPTSTFQATDYGAYFLNSLYEVLTEYGPIDEVWFDGASGNTGKTELYDYPAYYSLIRELQPEALVAVGGRDIRWVGNEGGHARQNEWGPVPVVNPRDGGLLRLAGSAAFEDVGARSTLVDAFARGATDLHWWPSETNMRLTGGWFAHPGDTPKSGPTMMEYWQSSYGRNTVLLLNVPPTTTGAFAPASVASLESFAALRRRAFTRDHARGVPVTAGGVAVKQVTDGDSRSSWVSGSAAAGVVEIDLGAPRRVDRVELGEDIGRHGQVVERFSVQALVNGTWTTIGSAGTIGAHRVLPLTAPVTAQRFRVQVEQARGPWSLATLNLWENLASDPGKLREVYLNCAASAAGDGSAARPFSSLEQFRTAELAQGATVHLSSANCADSTTPFWGYGTPAAPIRVVVDGPTPPTFGARTVDQVFGHLRAQGWVVPTP